MIAVLDSEWGLVFVVLALVLLFGSAQLPKLARSIGQAQKEFRKGQATAGQEEPKPGEQPALATAPGIPNGATPHEAASSGDQAGPVRL